MNDRPSPLTWVKECRAQIPVECTLRMQTPLGRIGFKKKPKGGVKIMKRTYMATVELWRSNVMDDYYSVHETLATKTFRTRNEAQKWILQCAKFYVPDAELETLAEECFKADGESNTAGECISCFDVLVHRSSARLQRRSRKKTFRIWKKKILFFPVIGTRVNRERRNAAL